MCQFLAWLMSIIMAYHAGHAQYWNRLLITTNAIPAFLGLFFLTTEAKVLRDHFLAPTTEVGEDEPAAQPTRGGIERIEKRLQLVRLVYVGRYLACHGVGSLFRS